MRIVKYVPIAGTWDNDAEWVLHPEQSDFVRFLSSRGLEPTTSGMIWNTRLNWLRGFTDDWDEGAFVLGNLLAKLPYADRNVIAHSHGGQLAILAAAQYGPIRTLTTIGTPHRRDMPVHEAARAITRWQHIYDKDSDRTASIARRLGQLGDLVINGRRWFDVPGVINIGIPGIGHSRMIYESRCFPLWEREGIIETIRDAGLRVVWPD